MSSMYRSTRLLLLCVALSVGLYGQTSAGSISGTVKDRQGGAIGGASVKATNQSTTNERNSKTDSAGDYNLAQLTPGRYKVRIEAAGFSPLEAMVDVGASLSTKFDPTVEVKGTTEAVTVIGDVIAAVQTDSAQISTVVTTKQLLEMPSLTRNPYDFVAVAAGAAPSSDGRGVGYAVNGQRSASGNYMLDGGENNDTFVAGVAQIVPLDTVQEFTLQTSNFTAEFGRGAGFVANVVTKSGSNQFHGSLYEFNRNSSAAANTFDNNANSQSKPIFNRNQFGFSAGGPVIKNKLFFFAGSEWIRVRSSRPVGYFVPTQELINISAPGTKAIFAAYPVPAGLSTSNVRRRTVTPFGSQTPVAINAFAQVFRNGPFDAGAGQPQDTLVTNFRGDYNINEKTSMFVRYAYQDSNQFASVNQAYSAKLDQPSLTSNHNALINVTRTWSPSFLSETRLAYNRFNGPTNPLVPGPSGFPGFSGTGDIGGINLPGGSSIFGGPQNIYQFYQSFSKNLGKHQIKAGMQYVQLRDNRSFGAYQNAVAVFANTQSFVNGNISRYTIAINPKGQLPGTIVPAPFFAPSFTRHYRYNEPSFFVQDVWKVSRRLTVNAGLRYEYFGVLHSPGEEQRLDANFYYGTGSTIQQRVATGAFARTLDKNDGKFYNPDYKNFAPRFGIAYDLFGTGKTVLRGGGGVFYDRNFGNAVFNAIQNPPSYATTFVTNVPATAALLTNQYAPLGTAPLALRGTSARHLDENLKTAYTSTWNVTLEHSFLSNYLGSMSYVGSRGDRLYSLNNLNRLGSGQFVGRPGQRLNATAASINSRGNDGFSNYQALQMKVASRFNKATGLGYEVNYTWSHSIDNNSNFFGDDGLDQPIGFGFIDAFNPQIDKGNSAFDIRHRVAASFVWEIPWMSKASNPIARNTLGGWSVAGVLNFQTGAPFSLADSNVGDYTGAENTRPVYVGGANNYSRIADASKPNYFNYLNINQAYTDDGDCITTAKPFQCAPSVNGPFKNILGRNTFRRPGTQFHNIVISKSVNLPREGMKLQFRSEFYNIFNHSNLYIDAGSVDIAAANYTAKRGGDSVPGAQAFFSDNRQIVFALKLIF